MDPKSRENLRSRRKNPDYAKIEITKELKARIMERAKGLNLSAMGLLELMMENFVLTEAVPKRLLDKYPSSTTAYRKTWRILLDAVEKRVVENPGSATEWLQQNCGNYTVKQVDAALNALVREGRVTRTVAGFFPVNTEVSG